MSRPRKYASAAEKQRAYRARVALRNEPKRNTDDERVYAFGYYGGKLSHLDRLLPLLPTSGVQTYVEPFAGSAAVLLNRMPAPVEVYNDLDGDLVTFFRVLREQPDALTRQIQRTPYSRAEFALACERRRDLPDLELARRFYVRINQSRSNVPNATPGQWSYAISTSNRGMASAVSGYWSATDRLEGVAARLKTVQIECLPAMDCIERYDTTQTLFYVDPPYVMATRSNHEDCYMHELTDSDHAQLAYRLQSVHGRVALSGYQSDLYQDLYRGWFITALPARAVASSPSKRVQQEVLWTNYDPATIHAMNDLPLFAVKPEEKTA